MRNLKFCPLQVEYPRIRNKIHGDFSAEMRISGANALRKGGMLVNEFELIFHEIFGKRDKLYKHIVQALENGPAEYRSLLSSQDMRVAKAEQILLDLTKGGFVTRDFTFSLKSGKMGRISQFRLSDNYLRFYLKYIEPRLDRIDKGRFEEISLSSLSGWETIMGFQFENFIIGNRNSILKILNIHYEDIIADNPYIQNQTKRKKGCQIDYLVQTKYNNVYLCEIKFSRHPLNSSVIEEVQQKNAFLNIAEGSCCFTDLNSRQWSASKC